MWCPSTISTITTQPPEPGATTLSTVEACPIGKPRCVSSMGVRPHPLRSDRISADTIPLRLLAEPVKLSEIVPTLEATLRAAARPCPPLREFAVANFDRMPLKASAMEDLHITTGR